MDLIKNKKNNLYNVLDLKKYIIKDKYENLINLAKILKPFATLYIVGGFVRNMLLKLPSEDIDLTSSLTIEELQNVLNNTSYKVDIKNKKFGTAKISCKNFTYEYTTFRKDYYNSGNHFPQKVSFIKSLTEDYLRRDFTINSIYYNILNNQIIDPSNGLNDIKKRLVRIITLATLDYDGERILRMIKYSCLLNFKIEKDTFIKAKQNNKNVYALNKSMIELYKQFFNSLTYFKRSKAKKITKKLELKNIFF